MTVCEGISYLSMLHFHSATLIKKFQMFDKKFEFT